MNLLIGDSHILCLQKYKNEKNELHQFSGSSIRGLCNDNSKTNAKRTILSLINNGKKYEKLFIMFGKVDLEWVYPYKCKDSIIDINDFINDTVVRYLQFIQEVSSTFKVIYVMGIHLPSLDANHMLRHINNHAAVTDVSTQANMNVNSNIIKRLDSLEARTKQTLLFNKILKEKLNGFEKYIYIDITDELLDTTTNFCDNKFIVLDDHHLDRDKTGLVWFNKHLHSTF